MRPRGSAVQGREASRCWPRRRAHLARQLSDREREGRGGSLDDRRLGIAQHQRTERAQCKPWRRNFAGANDGLGQHSVASGSLLATIDIACEVAAGGIGARGVGRNAARTAGAAATSGEASKPSTRRSGAKTLGLGATAWGVAAATRTEAVTASGSGGEAAAPGDAATGVAAATTSEACKAASPRSRSCQTKPMQAKAPISSPPIQIEPVRRAAPASRPGLACALLCMKRQDRGVAHPALPKLCRAEILGVAQARPAQIGIRQIGAEEIRVIQESTAQIGAAEICPIEFEHG